MKNLTKRTVAIIPARGGSKGIPLKNLQKVAGRTLLARAIDSARAATRIDTVIVSTDHDGIAEEAQRAGAEVVRRPADISGDQASSESALLYTLDQLPERYDITAFIQCTSPFIHPENLDHAIERVERDDADVVFSAVEDFSFLWTLDGQSHAVAVGHDAAFRPRRQDRPAHYNETGAFYIMRTAGLQTHRHRFFGRIEIEEVPAEHAREIDSMSDLSLARAVATQHDEITILDVDALVTDFDGVHTDDGCYVDEHGAESVRVHRGDGLGISRLARAGFPFLILSKERNPVVTRRAEKLRVEVAQGIDNKAEVLSAWIRQRGLDPARVAYIGNDINDLEAFSVVGWPIAVADAHPQVLAAARSILTRAGGRGAVREVCDLIDPTASGTGTSTSGTEPSTSGTEPSTATPPPTTD